MHILILLLALFAASPACPAPAQDTLVVGVDDQAPPFSFLDNNHFAGFDVDLIHALTEAADAEAGLTSVIRRDIVSALRDGKIDAAISGLILPRAPLPGITFSAPYLEGGLRILVRADTTDITGAEDLNGRIVGVLMDSPSANSLYSAAPSAMPSMFVRLEDSYQELVRGDLDAVWVDALVVEAHALDHCQGKVKTVGPVYASEAHVIFLREGSPWKDRLDAAIAKLETEGTIRELREKWFGKTGDGKPCPQ